MDLEASVEEALFPVHVRDVDGSKIDYTPALSKLKRTDGLETWDTRDLWDLGMVRFSPQAIPHPWCRPRPALWKENEEELEEPEKNKGCLLVDTWRRVWVMATKTTKGNPFPFITPSLFMCLCQCLYWARLGWVSLNDNKLLK